MNKEYLEMIGVDLSPKRFTFIQENETERVLDMVHEMAKAGYSGVVIDSVASLVSKRELEEQETTEGRMFGNSKALSSHLRYMTKDCSMSGTLALYLNQIRIEMKGKFTGETTPGGRALKYYSSVRIRTKVIEDLKDKEGLVIGSKIEASVMKNKVAPPYRKGEYDLIFGKGIDGVAGVFDAAVEAGLIQLKGSWYAFDGKNMAQGRPNALETLRENTTLVRTLADTLWSRT